jgi:hypothetical protein
MVERDPAKRIVTDAHGREQVIDIEAAPGHAARTIAEATGFPQLRQAHKRANPYQRPSETERERRQREARRQQERRAHDEARRKMFNLD